MHTLSSLSRGKTMSNKVQSQGHVSMEIMMPTADAAAECGWEEHRSFMSL